MAVFRVERNKGYAIIPCDEFSCPYPTWLDFGGCVSCCHQHGQRGGQGVSDCPFPSAGGKRIGGKNAERWDYGIGHLEQVRTYTPSRCRAPCRGPLRSPSAMGAAAPKPLPHSAERRSIFIAIFHCPIKIIQRSKGRSAVAAAAYRSGEKLINEWDGEIHDYTHKGGIVHREIMLPTHAPSEFSDRSTLWNSVEKIEKSSDAQLAREIEVALPVELSPAVQLALVRSYIKDNFVAAGMCADFAIHDKGTGNPHAHIMLTMRPIREDGSWGAKCRKVYDLDSQGQRIPDGKGGWKSHREDTTDWNNRGNAEKWRAAWASYVNRALEAAGRPERVDHRSYKRQGIEKIPTIHMGPAASQMERRGIATEKGNINRQISADNKLLKEIKARIIRMFPFLLVNCPNCKPTFLPSGRSISSAFPSTWHLLAGHTKATPPPYGAG